MSLFGVKVEEVLLAQVEDLTARLKAAETARDAERQRHEAKEAEFFSTQQDLIHTICLLKGIPIMEQDEHGNAVEVKTVPSVQRRTWAHIIAGKELEARQRSDERRRQVAEAAKRKTGAVQ